MRRIGVLMSLSESSPTVQARIAAFRQEFQRLGWSEGRNIRIDHRFAGGDANLVRAGAAELVKLNPDVILVLGTPALTAMRQETAALPIVFVQVADPVAEGFVTSLAHPGGNITGFAHYEYTIGGKWFEALREIAPRVSRIMFIRNPANVGSTDCCKQLKP